MARSLRSANHPRRPRGLRTQTDPSQVILPPVVNNPGESDIGSFTQWYLKRGGLDEVIEGDCRLCGGLDVTVRAQWPMKVLPVACSQAGVQHIVLDVAWSFLA